MRAAHQYRKLQFGHDVGVVETPLTHSFLLAGTEASIRPRRWSRGDLALMPRVTAFPVASIRPRRWSRGDVEFTFDMTGATSALQFGHDVGVVETACPRAFCAAASELQFGHDVGVVET